MTEAARLKHRTWTKDRYTISTGSSLVPLRQLNDALGSNDIYWTKSMPEHALRETLDNSLCFGLYDNGTEISRFIGLARCITDYTTFAYMTDVYVWPTHQGLGLGKWLIACVQELIESMPYLRRNMLFTSNWERSVPFYEKLMKMELIGSRRGPNGENGQGLATLQYKGPGFPDTL